MVHNPTTYSSIRKIQAVIYKIPFYRWLAANSHLVNLARQTTTIIDDKIRINRSTSRNTGKDKPAKILRSMKSIGDDVYDLTIRLIEEFRQQVLQDHAMFVVVNIPAKHQKPLSAYSKQDEIYPYVIRGEEVIGYLEKRNIKIVDLVPVLSNLPVSIYYFENDGHINKLGHEVVASRTYELILPDILQLEGQSVTE